MPGAPDAAVELDAAPPPPPPPPIGRSHTGGRPGAVRVAGDTV